MVEEEAKFIVEDKNFFKKFKSLKVIGIFSLESGEEKNLETFYFDTGDFLIYKSKRAAFRLRKEDGKYILTLKEESDFLNGISKRNEKYVILTNKEAESFEFLKENYLKNNFEEIVSISREKELKLVLKVSTKREIINVKSGEKIYFEIALDKVRFFSPLNNKNAYGMELEIEKREGSFDDFQNIISLFYNFFLLSPVRSSKYKEGIEKLGLI